MLTPGEVEPEESETDALERILETLNEAPSSPNVAVEPVSTEDLSTNEVAAVAESDDMFPPVKDESAGSDDGKSKDAVEEEDDDFQTFLRNHS